MGYQSIYNQLRANGLTEAGALGMLGNWDCESNCIAYRLQGDWSYPYNNSKQYTADVDSGRISRSQFSRDSKGYGLAQWTYYTRKEDLYDFWKTSGGSIGDEHLQVAFATHELSTEGEYAELWTLLRITDDVYTATDQICRKFERPYYNNVAERFAAAKRIQDEIDLDPQPVPPEPPAPPEPTPTVYWPPRTIDFHCADWTEVTVLGSVLYCRGYLDYAAGYWDEEVTEAVERFQRDKGLKADGVVGNLTWDKLLERR